jgi:iron(III) transport system ATP-binding protein
MALRAAAISKRTKNGWLIRDVSFTAESGAVFGIFGPAGSGKNMLLSILAGREKPGSGTSSSDVDGTDKTRRIRLVGSQEARSWWNIFKGSGAEQSPGKEQLAAIDEALASDAHVLLFNEAFSHLDRDLRSHLYGRIREQATANNICVVTATADFNEVLEFCEGVAVLSRGEVIQAGSPDEVYRSPSSSLTARLTGRIVLIEARRLSSSKADVPEFQSIKGSHILRTKKFERSGLGALNQNVLLGIRPEHISISTGASFPEDNLLKAVITDVKFLGPSTLVMLDANGLTIQALVMRLVGLRPGDECMVGLPPDRLMIFPK